MNQPLICIRDGVKLIEPLRQAVACHLTCEQARLCLYLSLAFEKERWHPQVTERWLGQSRARNSRNNYCLNKRPTNNLRLTLPFLLPALLGKSKNVVYYT